MKKRFLGIIPLVMLLTVCASGAKPAENSGGMMTLDQALKEAAVRIDQRLAARTKIAPLNFNSPHDKFSGYALDELTANLVDSGKLTVVDRKEVDLIRGEFDFQLSGEVGDDSMQQLGRMLGAQSIISGSLTDMGGFYRIVIRVLNVQNASVEVQYRANIASDAVTTALLTGGKTTAASTGSAARQTSATPTKTQPTAVPVTPAPLSAPPPQPTTYKVGDTGPAGGIIFYDKGNNSDGWRYLEAASRDAGKVAWGGVGRNVDRMGIEIGTGKQNTQTIVNFMMERGINTPAAMICRQYNQGGYSDWFLPSKAELNLMYWNLKQQGKGNMESGGYLSSSHEGSDNYRHVWGQDFGDGSQGTYNGVDHRLNVRAIRQF